MVNPRKACFILFLLYFVAGCKDSIELVSLSDETVEDTDDFVDEETDIEKIFITDRTGKKWDITHAVNQYDLVPERFQFGLGPNAIPPIIGPEMISQGEPGYPGDTDAFLTLGTSLNDQPRGYKLSILSRHEIVDEVFGDAHVAVAY